jgi:hypothetical protein
MTHFFILVTRKTEPSVKLVFILRDQGAARNATFTNIARALLLNFTLRLLFVIFKTIAALKVSVAEVAGNSNPCTYARWTQHAVATLLIAYMCSADVTPFVTRLANLTFGHGARQVSYEVIVFCHLVKQKIDASFRFVLSFKHDTILLQPRVNHDLIFETKMFLNSD